MKKSRKYLLFGVVVLVIFFILVATGERKYEHPFVVLDDVDSSLVEGVKDAVVVIQEEGWSTPVKLQANDEGREDSTYITRDGRYVLFYHDPLEGEFRESRQGRGDNPQKEIAKLYYTKRPFVTKTVHPVSANNKINVQAGPYISEKGDLYYTQTFIVTEPEPHLERPNKTVVNGGKRIIDMGTGEAEADPHYCDAMDELYVNIVYPNDDQNIAVFKNGKATILPEPINVSGEKDFQPFLTDDCQTMYFTSTRAGKGSGLPLQVYKSNRLGDFSWSEPELFIAFPQSMVGGVGEFSMTRDGKQMVFLQLTIEGVVGQTDMYYSEKIER